MFKTVTAKRKSYDIFKTFSLKFEQKNFDIKYLSLFPQVQKNIVVSVSHMACQPHNLVALCSLITFIKVSTTPCYFLFLQEELELLSSIISNLYDSHT